MPAERPAPRNFASLSETPFSILALASDITAQVIPRQVLRPHGRRACLFLECLQAVYVISVIMANHYPLHGFVGDLPNTL